MSKSYSYYLLIFIIIELFPETLLNSEIKLVFKGRGDKQILYSSFQYEPSEVIVNGNIKASCKKTCYLENEDKNEVILKFQTQINSCVNMFNGLNNLIEADLSNFDASKVIDMTSMFLGCTKLKKIDFGDIDTSSVKSIKNIFKNCEELTFIDMSKFNNKNLENMLDAFAFCYKLIAVNLKNFDTSKITIMRGIFYRCKSLKYADLSSFQTSALTDVQYMFQECKDLIYADLSSFRISNTILTTEQFREVNSNLKICVNDRTTISFMPGSRNECSDKCFNENIKIDLSQNTCINNCNECLNRYEYYNLCFDICPGNTYPIIDEFLCLDKKPKGYYLENSINKYKPCYELCSDCNEEGNEINNNCIECKNGYDFLEDSMYHSNGNCYEICNDFFYFDEFNRFRCESECPENFNKIINEKNKCINECKNDDTYRFEYNNICFENCPNESRHLYNYYCIDEIINNQDIYLKLIKNKVINKLSIEELNMNNDLTFINKEVIYEISTTSNKNNNFLKNNVTSVNLGDCINKLKDKYNISKNEEVNLYILKIDIPLEGMKIPKIEYEVYYPLYNETLFQLDLSVCQNTRINISIPINISLDDLDLYNSSSGLYNDICNTLTTNSGTDKCLKDRRNEFIDKNLTVCEENCIFIDYDNTTKKAICSCYTKINLPIISEVKINKNLLLSNFKDINNIGNFKMLKCFYLILQKNNIFKNSSNYLILLIILISIVTIIIFSFHDYFYIKKIIEKFKKNKKLKVLNINETKNITKKQNKNINNKNNLKKVIKPNQIKKRNYKKYKKIKKYKLQKPESKKIKIYHNHIDIYYSNTRKYNKKMKNKKQIKHKIIKRKLLNKFYYIDAELNDLEYKDAIRIDKRTYFQYYLSLLKEKHLFIFSFITKNDYNSRIL